MTNLYKQSAICLFLITFALTSFAENKKANPLKVGDQAPDFKLLDSEGKSHSLSQYTKTGHYVVLEWFNHHCPYVKKHYTQDEQYKKFNMQTTQKDMKALKDKKVAWLSINSTYMDMNPEAKKTDFKNAEQTKQLIKETNTQSTAVLIDSTSEVGMLYEAKTTPHMFVINPEGKIIYMGAIDNNDSHDPKTLVNAKNYVKEALMNKKIETSFVKPYGCGVKYPPKKKS